MAVVNNRIKVTLTDTVVPFETDVTISWVAETMFSKPTIVTRSSSVKVYNCLDLVQSKLNIKADDGYHVEDQTHAATCSVFQKSIGTDSLPVY